VEKRQADGQLQLIVTLHHDVCVLPAPSPRPTMALEKAIEAGRAGAIEGVDRWARIGDAIGVSPVDGESVERAASSPGL
jgi:hypothetical protein